MDTLELIARSEWPLIVGSALIFFRQPLVALIGCVAKVEGWGLKAEFKNDLDKVDTWTPPSTDELKLMNKITIDEKSQVDPLNTWLTSSFLRYTPEPSPEAVVLGAWTSLEANMRAMIDAIHPRPAGEISVSRRAFYKAAKEFGLTPDELQSLKTLHNLRDKVAHSTESTLDWDDAVRFQAATERLLIRMKVKWDELRKSKQPPPS